MHTHISKWGNSLGVRIPLYIAEKVGLIEGESVELIVVDDQILIQKEYSLKSLLLKITPDNVHSEIDLGDQVGKEVW